MSINYCWRQYVGDRIFIMTDLSQSFVSNIRMIPISVQTVVDKWNSSKVNSLKKSVTEIFSHQEYSLTKNVDKPRRINIEWKNSNKNPNNPSNKIHAKLCLSECLFSFSLMLHDSDWLKNDQWEERFPCIGRQLAMQQLLSMLEIIALQILQNISFLKGFWPFLFF